MIKFEHTEVMNMRNALRGMRNPMNSWDKADSVYCAETDCFTCPHWEENGKEGMCPPFDLIIGENDMNLCKKLRNAGSDHRKYLRQIFVSVDICAPLYFFKEFDTYKVATVANSTSTMHKIHAKEFTLDDFSHEHLKGPWLDRLEETIASLNSARHIYVNWNNESETIKKWFDNDKKEAWWQMIHLLPSSYNQLRTVTMNYETLINMYHARKNHKLDEWHDLCDWIKTLPYAKELIIGE